MPTFLLSYTCILTKIYLIYVLQQQLHVEALKGDCKQSVFMINTSLTSYTIFHGDGQKAAPAIFLLNGFNVASSEYSELLLRLCSKGLTVASSDAKRVVANITGMPRPGCPENYTVINGKQLYELFTTQDPQATQYQKVAKNNGIILLGHSYGGAIAAGLMSGICDHGSSSQDQTCEGYKPMKDCRGNNILKSAVLYEGYWTGAVKLGPGQMIAYIAGQFNNATWDNGYRNTTGYKVFARLGKNRPANHYGLCNYVEGVGGNQVTKCSRPASTDPIDFKVSEEEQKENIKLVSDICMKVALGYYHGKLHHKLDFVGLRKQLLSLEQSCEWSACLKKLKMR